MPLSSLSLSDTRSVTSSSSTSSSSPPFSPSRGTFPSTPTKIHHAGGVGVDPTQLIGKVLKGVRRSPTHPNVTLYFTDNTAFQILVDGYDPRHRGVPKTIEMDSGLEPIFNHTKDLREVHLTVSNAARVTLADKAFDKGGRGSKWDQTHRGIALKFKEDNQWHCVWATLAEYDDVERMNCTFRSYHDVYLDVLDQPATSRKRRSRKRGQGYSIPKVI
ncbi:uncharacterized protein FIBRA_03535 [Fibroporia radiculosa]|uniref:Uncharacterized protein n=1 Tax=Fibroporia radiculosa TaxID=599839 RepID=J4I9N7_9APHY|nr:uncharacterized protein FIBRA_03535 [Fibroporia radiculosa]CCM01481.1 predicted protein [Fibroporia radiculosa]